VSKTAPATHHTYGGIVVGLLSFASVFFLAGIGGLVFLANGAHITGIPGCMFVIAGTLTILGFVFALAGRNLDCIRAIGGIDDETGEIRRPVIQARRMDGEFVGVTGRRYGTVPMQKPRADTTVYGGESATMEQPAVIHDRPHLVDMATTAWAALSAPATKIAPSVVADAFDFGMRIGRRDAPPEPPRS
jgi:hypothetical protein